MTALMKFAAALVAATLPAAALGQDLSCPMTGVPLSPSMVDKHRAELSAVIVEPGRLLTISNEGIGGDKRQHSLQVFRGTPAAGYRFERDIAIFSAAPGACSEADFEGLASANGHYFAIGSHSRMSPKKAKKKWSEEKAANKLGDEANGVCSSRYQLLKFKIAADGQARMVVATSLRGLIESHPVLRDYTELANKSGGIDIEGLAATSDALYAGFRGPVLPDDRVPVLKLPQNLDAGQQLIADLRFIRLGGRGIRAMTAGPGGLYILAGPTGNEPQTFALYRWNGEDQTAQSSGPAKLCDLGAHDETKPEGIAVIEPSGDAMRFMLVFDGPPPLRATTITVPAGR